MLNCWQLTFIIIEDEFDELDKLDCKLDELAIYFMLS